MLEHRRALVAARTLGLHHVGDQIAKLPTEIRDQLNSKGKIESRLRRLEGIDADIDTTPAGAYRLEWLHAFIEQDRTARHQIRRLERLIDELLDEHGTTLRDEAGIGPIAATTLLCEVGDPHRFDPASPSSPAGAAPAPSPSPQAKARATPSSTDSTSEATDASTACSTSRRSPSNAASPTRPPTSPAKPPKARPDAKPDEPTNANSPTGSSAACGATKPPDNSPTH